MMKKALSLLLTLAMVMSMFTVGAFADTAVDSGSTTGTVAVTPASAQIVEGGKTTLTAGSLAPAVDTEAYTVKSTTYAWEVPSGLSGTSTTGSIELTGVTAQEAAYTVTCTVTVKAEKKTATPPATEEGGEESQAQTEDVPAETEETTFTYTGTASVTVVANNFEMKLVSRAGGTAPTAAQTMRLAPGGSGTLTLDAKLYTKGTEGTEAAEVSGVTYETASSNTSVATVSGTAVTAVAGGTANITVTATYMGRTYSKTICAVTVNAISTPLTIINGGSGTVSAATLVASLNSALGLSGSSALTATSVSLTPRTGIFDAYTSGSSTAAASAIALTSGSVTIRAKAGSIGSDSWTYTIVASDGKTYTGALELKSDFASTSSPYYYQTLAFAKEWSFMDGIYGIDKVRSYSASEGASSYATATSAVKTTSYRLDPDAHSADWIEELVGYGPETNPVAYRISLRVTMKPYDLADSCESGEKGFLSNSDMTDFATKVMYEQDYDTYRTSSALSLYSVRFTAGSGYTLYNGTSKATYGSLTCTDMSQFSVTVDRPGVYTIPFTVTVQYRPSSSYSYATAAQTRSYDGVLSLLVSSEGDIQYETSYNESVTFKTADFQAFYRKATSRTNARLDRVVFEGQPQTGALYAEPNRYQTSYLLSSSASCYVTPTGANVDLGKVTYQAPNLPRTEYSVFIPFTAYGDGAIAKGVVEVIVNSALPFTDIKENHTFYEFIRYCYRNDIIRGKTDTYFDATSPVTRIQLVRMLYRMAGSPAVNYSAISFTDCKSLGTEAANALRWALANGIVDGYSDNTFKPNSAVTRQALVTILYRFAERRGYDTSVLSSSNLAAFKDAAKVSSGMKVAMNWAVDCGFVSGNGGNLMPGGSTTRGAAAKILASFHGWYMA